MLGGFQIAEEYEETFSIFNNEKSFLKNIFLAFQSNWDWKTNMLQTGQIAQFELFSHLPSDFLQLSFLWEQDILAIIIQVDLWHFLFIWVGKVNVSAKNNAKGKNNIMALVLICDLEDNKEIQSENQNGISGKENCIFKETILYGTKNLSCFYRL